MPTKQPSNPNQAVTLIAVLLIIIGIGGTFQFLNPGLDLAATNLAQAKAEDEGILNDITTLQNAQTQTDAAKKALTQKGLDFNSLSYVFPQYEDIPNFYIQMEYLVGSVPGVTATYQISPPISGAAGDARVPVALSATGSYADLKAFLVALENNMRPISITNLSLAPAPTKDSNGKEVDGASSKYIANISGYVRSQGISAAYQAKK